MLGTGARVTIDAQKPEPIGQGKQTDPEQRRKIDQRGDFFRA